MGYARLHHWYWHDPKFHKLPAATERLWTRALAYADYHLTDGFISLSALKDLSGTRAQADKLTAVGLWHAQLDGWQINRYLEYAASRAEVERKREVTRRRQQRHRERTRSSEQPAMDVAPPFHASSNEVETQWKKQGNSTQSIEEMGQNEQRNERETNQNSLNQNYEGAGQVAITTPRNALLTQPTATQLNSTQHNTGLRGVTNVEVVATSDANDVAGAPGMDDRCEQHRFIPLGQSIPPCHRCRDRRLANERKLLERDHAVAQAARTRRECSWCDESGWALDAETGETIVPAVKCNHRHLQEVSGL
ncbi:hypothetical protein CGLAR1_09785 [Corynebacterium glutamicum]|nr:hypothetical protein CGLAR1_09785 [Corynebacterium glutamicum]AIK88315.1 hypothetical protein AR0_09935 [Corynebacterium glutamicum]